MKKYNKLISICCLLLMICSFSFARAEKIEESSTEKEIKISETSSEANQENELPSEDHEKLLSSPLSAGEEPEEGEMMFPIPHPKRLYLPVLRLQVYL